MRGRGREGASVMACVVFREMRAAAGGSAAFGAVGPRDRGPGGLPEEGAGRYESSR